MFAPIMTDEGNVNWAGLARNWETIFGFCYELDESILDIEGLNEMLVFSRKQMRNAQANAWEVQERNKEEG